LLKSNLKTLLPIYAKALACLLPLAFGDSGGSVMQIRDIMTQDVQTIDSGASAIEAAAKMRELDVGSLPVCDGERLQGLLTDRDIAIRLVAAGLDASTTKVSEIMTPDAAYCFDDQTLDEAAVLMEAHQIRRLPILNRDKQLIGMLSLGDLAVRTAGTEDRELADEVLNEISEPPPSRRL
jgi:CBS domain-containing protein